MRNVLGWIVITTHIAHPYEHKNLWVQVSPEKRNSRCSKDASGNLRNWSAESSAWLETMRVKAAFCTLQLTNKGKEVGESD